jgi:plastocyanin
VDVPHDCPKPASKLEISAVNDSWIGPNGKPAKPGATCLAAPADEPFTVTVHNDIHNEGLYLVNHTFSVYTDSTGTDGLFNGDLVLAGDSFTYHVPSLEVGAYAFKCDIHPQTMTGVLVVE